jgi:hypothetical protein
VVNKILASTRSDTIAGRRDIFAARARRLDQIERREIGSVQREGTDNGLQANDMSAARRPSRALPTDVILDVGASLKGVAAQPPIPAAQIGIGTSLELSGALRKRVATEGSAALSRLS